MDYLKSRAPFWKKETGRDGARWVGGAGGGRGGARPLGRRASPCDNMVT